MEMAVKATNRKGKIKIMEEAFSCTEKGNVGMTVWPEACVMFPQAVPEVMDVIIYFNWISICLSE